MIRKQGVVVTSTAVLPAKKPAPAPVKPAEPKAATTATAAPAAEPHDAPKNLDERKPQ